jgi:hypothetical protein
VGAVSCWTIDSRLLVVNDGDDTTEAEEDVLKAIGDVFEDEELISSVILDIVSYTLKVAETESPASSPSNNPSVSRSGLPLPVTISLSIVAAIVVLLGGFLLFRRRKKRKGRQDLTQVHFGDDGLQSDDLLEKNDSPYGDLEADEPFDTFADGPGTESDSDQYDEWDEEHREAEPLLGPDDEDQSGSEIGNITTYEDDDTGEQEDDQSERADSAVELLQNKDQLYISEAGIVSGVIVDSGDSVRSEITEHIAYDGVHTMFESVITFANVFDDAETKAYAPDPETVAFIARVTDDVVVQSLLWLSVIKVLFGDFSFVTLVALNAEMGTDDGDVDLSRAIVPYVREEQLVPYNEENQLYDGSGDTSQLMQPYRDSPDLAALQLEESGGEVLAICDEADFDERQESGIVEYDEEGGDYQNACIAGDPEYGDEDGDHQNRYIEGDAQYDDENGDFQNRYIEGDPEFDVEGGDSHYRYIEGDPEYDIEYDDTQNRYIEDVADSDEEGNKVQHPSDDAHPNASVAALSATARALDDVDSGSEVSFALGGGYEEGPEHDESMTFEGLEGSATEHASSNDDQEEGRGDNGSESIANGGSRSNYDDYIDNVDGDQASDHLDESTDGSRQNQGGVALAGAIPDKFSDDEQDDRADFISATSDEGSEQHINHEDGQNSLTSYENVMESPAPDEPEDERLDGNEVGHAVADEANDLDIGEGQNDEYYQGNDQGSYQSGEQANYYESDDQEGSYQSGGDQVIYHEGDDNCSYNEGDEQEGSYQGDGQGSNQEGDEQEGSYQGDDQGSNQEGDDQQGSYQGGDQGSFHDDNDEGRYQGGAGQVSYHEVDDQGSYQEGGDQGSYIDDNDRESYQGDDQGSYQEGGDQGSYLDDNDRGSYQVDQGSYQEGDDQESYQGGDQGSYEGHRGDVEDQGNGYVEDDRDADEHGDIDDGASEFYEEDQGALSEAARQQATNYNYPEDDQLGAIESGSDRSYHAETPGQYHEEDHPYEGGGGGYYNDAAEGSEENYTEENGQHFDDGYGDHGSFDSHQNGGDAAGGDKADYQEAPQQPGELAESQHTSALTYSSHTDMRPADQDHSASGGEHDDDEMNHDYFSEPSDDS